MSIQRIATTMRRRAEAFARMKEYDDESLVTMCSTVSHSLAIVLKRAGFVAWMVGGTFDGTGHFWVEVAQPTLTVVDITATQFDDFDERAPRVLITRYTDAPWGPMYTPKLRARGDVRRAIQVCDLDDVQEFERRTRTWLDRCACATRAA